MRYPPEGIRGVALAHRGGLRLDGHDEGWPVITLHDAAGDEPDEPFVPIARAEKDHRQVGALLDCRLGSREGLFEHAVFDRLALGVEGVELGGDGAGLYVVFGGEQPCAEA